MGGAVHGEGCSWGGVWSEGACSHGGMPAPGWSGPRGVPALAGGGGVIPACNEADPPPVNRMTDRCKNITFATSLRTVKLAFCALF